MIATNNIHFNGKEYFVPDLEKNETCCDYLKRFRKHYKYGNGIDFLNFLEKFPGLPGSKYPGEKHLNLGLMHNFTGPGTRNEKGGPRLDENDNPRPDSIPVNRIDEASMKHDIIYRDDIDDNIEIERQADRAMIHEMDNISNPTTREKFERAIVKKALQIKLKLGKGLDQSLQNLSLQNKKLLALELHKKTNKIKNYRKNQFFHKNNIWVADLMVMPKDNDFKYILVVKDGYTKFLWTIPLKSKKGLDVRNAFDKIIKSAKEKPYKLWVDSGKEFYNQHMYELFKFKKSSTMKKDENGKYINDIYSVFNENKANLAERQVRYLREKFSIEFTIQGNQKWIHLLPKITKKYNESIHSTLKISPAEAYKNPENIKQFYEINPNNQTKIFKKDDRVRIPKLKNTFEKSSTRKWTNEIFIIDEAYQLKDLNNEPIHSLFYAEELNKTKF